MGNPPEAGFVCFRQCQDNETERSHQMFKRLFTRPAKLAANENAEWEKLHDCGYMDVPRHITSARHRDNRRDGFRSGATFGRFI
jgi:hypothetical protein